MDKGAGRTTPRARPHTRQRARPLGTFRARVLKEVSRLIKATKGESLARQPPNEMAGHRRIRLLVRRTALTCGVHRQKQREHQPIPSRTPPLDSNRSNETPAPHWVRRNETQSH